jgi:hypothetical protein
MKVKAKARLLTEPDLANGTWKAVVMVKGPKKGDLVEMKGELRAKTLRTRGGEKRTRPVLLLEGAALAVGDPTAAVGSSGERGNMTAERAKKVAKEALKTGGDPRLAWQILLSTLTGEEEEVPALVPYLPTYRMSIRKRGFTLMALLVEGETVHAAGAKVAVQVLPQVKA